MTDEVTVVEEMSMTCVMRFSHYMHSISLSPHDTVQLVMSIPDLLTALSNTVQKGVFDYHLFKCSTSVFT